MALASAAPTAAGLVLPTNDGEVPVDVATGGDGLETRDADLRSTVGPRRPRCSSVGAGCLGWRLDELDPALPPAVAFAGAKHLVLAVQDLDTLGRMAYAFDP